MSLLVIARHVGRAAFNKAGANVGEEQKEG
jgi:hypothetical protein